MLACDIDSCRLLPIGHQIGVGWVKTDAQAGLLVAVKAANQAQRCHLPHIDSSVGSRSSCQQGRVAVEGTALGPWKQQSMSMKTQILQVWVERSRS